MAFRCDSSKNIDARKLRKIFDRVIPALVPTLLVFTLRPSSLLDVIFLEKACRLF